MASFWGKKLKIKNLKKKKSAFGEEHGITKTYRKSVLGKIKN